MNDSPALPAANIVFAAGRGTRMLGYAGNKTLLPLIPKTSAYDGDHPLLHGSSEESASRSRRDCRSPLCGRS